MDLRKGIRNEIMMALYAGYEESELKYIYKLRGQDINFLFSVAQLEEEGLVEKKSGDIYLTDKARKVMEKYDSYLLYCKDMRIKERRLKWKLCKKKMAFKFYGLVLYLGRFF